MPAYTRSMNALIEFTGIVFDLALSFWIGGGLVLGVLVAPALFRHLPDRAQAGELFGNILRRDARLRAVAFVLLVITAIVRYTPWQALSSSPIDAWLLFRWAAIGVMGLTLLLQLMWLYPDLEALRLILQVLEIRPDEPGARPAEPLLERLRFEQLHKLSELTVKVGLVAAVALLISA